MNIQWFPGHMTKSLRMIEENLKLVDAVIYILDARAPKSCLNPSLDGLIKNKPVVYVLNKADLVEKDFLSNAKEFFVAKGKNIITLNSTVSKSASSIISEVKRMCEEKLQRAERRGIKTVLRAMVVGIPNGGKSTFINNLSGAGKTVTGNKAGVTRGKQWVTVGEFFEVLDTPGTLYPKLDNYEKAKRLAYIGSIKDEILDITELAVNFIKDLDAINPDYISSRYKINNSIEESDGVTDNSDDFLQHEFYDSTESEVADKAALNRLKAIAKSRGFIKKGGVFDVEKAAVALIDDFRKGRLGKIALETFDKLQK